MEQDPSLLFLTTLFNMLLQQIWYDLFTQALSSKNLRTGKKKTLILNDFKKFGPYVLRKFVRIFFFGYKAKQNRKKKQREKREKKATPLGNKFP